MESREMPESQAAPETDVSTHLLRRHLAGDGTAFGELVALYEERLFAFIARMTGDSHLAEDVFQQTWLKAARSAASFDGRGAFSTWLFRIARNAALDELRRRRHDRPASGPEMEALANRPDANAATPLETLTAGELARRVRAALAALPEAQREAFLLKEEADLDFAAIGAILGCGRETAKSRFRLAVEKLRRLLGAEEGVGP